MSMAMTALLVLALSCTMLSHVLTHQQHGVQNQKFLMVLFDGLRWDYLDFEGLDNFKRFEKAGVRALYMEPDFPSLSFPGYYTVLTGLHSESHGFIGNCMYDHERNKYFETHLRNDSNEPFWWEQSEPLWTESMRAGKKTYVYLWPGCHVPIHGVKPNYCRPYESVDGVQLLQEQLGDIIDKFSTGVADVGFVYAEIIDIIGHRHGPNSIELKNALKDLDQVIGKLLDNISAKSLTEKVNIIFVSDHGMKEIDSHKTTVVKIADIVNIDYVDMFIEGGSYMAIKPKVGFLEQVYKSLQNIPCIHVWKKEDIPEELHYKHNSRVLPILIAAKPSCRIEKVPNSTKQWPPYTPSPVTKQQQQIYGTHGYLPKENPEMRAIFLAMGPAIIEKGKVPSIHATDVYNLASHLIGIHGHPNNGTWSHVSDVLKSAPSGASVPRFAITTFLVTFGFIWAFLL